MKRFVKDPDAVLDYAIDWSRWLVAGDAVQSALWTAPSGISIDDDALSGALATVWLSGGTPGETYVVTCSITTTMGRADDRSILIAVEER